MVEETDAARASHCTSNDGTEGGMTNSGRQDGRRISMADLRLLSLLLGIMCLAFIPVLLLAEPMEWIPSCPDSFWKTVCEAFAKSDEHGYYMPTTIVSLACDYFTFGCDRPVFYSIHSLFGLLCRTVFLWLLLRRFNASRTSAVFFCLITAAPDYLVIAITPIARGNVALTLFSCAALWTTSHLNSRCWQVCAAVASLSCFIALGTSPVAVCLIPLMLGVVYVSKRLDGSNAIPIRRVVLPEIVALATFVFVILI
ncbi:MAG: hypothetical protein MJ106_07200 [Lentisphaeria bacterium]|nr:hypothetical protein [Lentisphaeria bacterium]